MVQRVHWGRQFQEPKSIDEAQNRIKDLLVEILNIKGQLAARRHKGGHKGYKEWDWSVRAQGALATKERQVAVLRQWVNEKDESPQVVKSLLPHLYRLAARLASTNSITAEEQSLLDRCALIVDRT